MSVQAEIDRSRVPAPGPLRPFHFPPIERMELSNGVPLLFARSPGFGVASVGVLAEAGGVHEDAERAGLATLTTSLLESGAAGRTAAEVADEMERLGVQLTAGTTWEAAHLELTGLTSRLEAALGIAADLVLRPAFPEGEVERLRQEQVAGILQRRAEPRSLANEVATRYIFAEESPFSRPLSGSPRTVERLTRSDVSAFHRARYAPQAAAVVIAGDLDADEALRLAEDGFAGWVGVAPPAAAPPVGPRFESPHVIVVDRPGSVQSEIRVGHLGVARDTGDYFPLVVMNAILGGAFSSRLNLNLRERHGFTYGVSSSFVMRREPGPFLVSTAVQTEVTAAALTEIVGELERIREAPVRPGELADARTYLAGVFPLRLQTTEGVASRLAELAIYRLPLDYFEHYRDRILEVTAEDVLRVAREHVRPEHAVAVIVGDAGQIQPALEGLGLGPVTVVPADESD